jgi:flagellar basal body-associated protein FliL
MATTKPKPKKKGAVAAARKKQPPWLWIGVAAVVLVLAVAAIASGGGSDGDKTAEGVEQAAPIRPSARRFPRCGGSPSTALRSRSATTDGRS